VRGVHLADWPGLGNGPAGTGLGEEQGPKGKGHMFESCRGAPEKRVPGLWRGRSCRRKHGNGGLGISFGDPARKGQVGANLARTLAAKYPDVGGEIRARLRLLI
jgi:hypothetical protein